VPVGRGKKHDGAIDIGVEIAEKLVRSQGFVVCPRELEDSGRVARGKGKEKWPHDGYVLKGSLLKVGSAP
jgi:hypothetical protein